MRGVLFGLCALAAVFVSPVFAQTSPPPVEAFGRLPAIADAAISPDGTKVATAEFRDGQGRVSVYDIDQRRQILAIAAGENQQLRSVGWADDTHLTLLINITVRPGQVLPEGVRFRGAPRRVNYFRNGLVDLTTQRIQLLTTNAEEPWADTGSQLIAPIEGDPGFGLMVGRSRTMEANYPVIYRVNLATGQARNTQGIGANNDTIDYVFDERGVAVRLDSDRESNRWRAFVYDQPGREPRKLLEGTSPTGAPLNIVGLLPDGRLAVVDVEDDGELFVLHAINRTTGEQQLLYKAEGYELDGAIIDPWSRRVVGVRWIEQEAKQHFFVPELEAAYAHVSAMIDNGAAHLVSWSRDYKRVLIFAEQGLDGGGYFVFNTTDNSMRRVAMAYPEIASSPLGTRQALTYRARDGTRIPAYLTLPQGAEAHNLPTVVLVHGGPRSRDTLDFDWWATFLASRGYAVLQPNFRGSSGYGATWQHAGDGQWGALMQTDVEDGVAALARAGMIDPARVCIVGASYGGYAALAGAALTPTRYRCAASIAGVSDLEAMLRSVESATGGSQSMASDYWRLSIGDRQEDRERIRSVSPVNLAANVTAPVLLIHGTDDTVVSIEHSRRMNDRLRAVGKNVRFVELQGDDHWLSDAETRIQMLRELETFLAANIGPNANRPSP